MILENREISLEEGAKILKIQKKSLKMQLIRGVIPGEKDENGRWHIYLFDILYYKENRGKSREAPQGSLTVKQTAHCLKASREEVINMVIEGILKGEKICNTWYIFRSSVIRVLKKQAESSKSPSYIEECNEHIKILSPYGIDSKESVEIVRWLDKHPFHDMTIYKKDIHNHETHQIVGCLDLMLLKISKNEIISLKFSGLFAHMMMKEFNQMNTNLFRSNS